MVKYFYNFKLWLTVVAFLSLWINIPWVWASERQKQPLLVQSVRWQSQQPYDLQLTFDTGQTDLSNTQQLDKQIQQHIFDILVGLTLPESKLWVNLSPTEQHRIIDPTLSKTQIGQDLLELDYALKQLTSALFHPESDLGQDFWSEFSDLEPITEERHFHNKVWIIPGQIQVHETTDHFQILHAELDVMLDEDFLQRESSTHAQPKTDSKHLQWLRKHMLPAIKTKINSDVEFVRLRQIFQNMIIAKWLKTKMVRQPLLAHYINGNKMAGVPNLAGDMITHMYNNYVDSYHQGAFSHIMEEYDVETATFHQRRYFSGGISQLSSANWALVHQPIKPVGPQLKIDLSVIPMFKFFQSQYPNQPSAAIPNLDTLNNISEQDTSITFTSPEHQQQNDRHAGSQWLKDWLEILVTDSNLALLERAKMLTVTGQLLTSLRNHLAPEAELLFMGALFHNLEWIGTPDFATTPKIIDIHNDSARPEKINTHQHFWKTVINHLVPYLNGEHIHGKYEFIRSTFTAITDLLLTIEDAEIRLMIIESLKSLHPLLIKYWSNMIESHDYGSVDASDHITQMITIYWTINDQIQSNLQTIKTKLEATAEFQNDPVYQAVLDLLVVVDNDPTHQWEKLKNQWTTADLTEQNVNLALKLMHSFIQQHPDYAEPVLQLLLSDPNPTTPHIEAILNFAQSIIYETDGIADDTYVANINLATLFIDRTLASLLRSPLHSRYAQRLHEIYALIPDITVPILQDLMPDQLIQTEQNLFQSIQQFFQNWRNFNITDGGRANSQLSRFHALMIFQKLHTQNLHYEFANLSDSDMEAMTDMFLVDLSDKELLHWQDAWWSELNDWLWPHIWPKITDPNLIDTEKNNLTQQALLLLKHQPTLAITNGMVESTISIIEQSNDEGLIHETAFAALDAMLSELSWNPTQQNLTVQTINKLMGLLSKSSFSSYYSRSILVKFFNPQLNDIYNPEWREYILTSANETWSKWNFNTITPENKREWIIDGQATHIDQFLGLMSLYGEIGGLGHPVIERFKPFLSNPPSENDNDYYIMPGFLKAIESLNQYGLVLTPLIEELWRTYPDRSHKSNAPSIKIYFYRSLNTILQGMPELLQHSSEHGTSKDQPLFKLVDFFRREINNPDNSAFHDDLIKIWQNLKFIPKEIKFIVLEGWLYSPRYDLRNEFYSVLSSADIINFGQIEEKKSSYDYDNMLWDIDEPNLNLQWHEIEPILNKVDNLKPPSAFSKIKALTKNLQGYNLTLLEKVLDFEEYPGVSIDLIQNLIENANNNKEAIPDTVPIRIIDYVIKYITFPFSIYYGEMRWHGIYSSQKTILNYFPKISLLKLKNFLIKSYQDKEHVTDYEGKDYEIKLALSHLIDLIEKNNDIDNDLISQIIELDEENKRFFEELLNILAKISKKIHKNDPNSKELSEILKKARKIFEKIVTNKKFEVSEKEEAVRLLVQIPATDHFDYFKYYIDDMAFGKELRNLSLYGLGFLTADHLNNDLWLNTIYDFLLQLFNNKDKRNGLETYRIIEAYTNVTRHYFSLRLSDTALTHDIHLKLYAYYDEKSLNKTLTDELHMVFLDALSILSQNPAIKSLLHISFLTIRFEKTNDLMLNIKNDLLNIIRSNKNLNLRVKAVDALFASPRLRQNNNFFEMIRDYKFWKENNLNIKIMKRLMQTVEKYAQNDSRVLIELFQTYFHFERIFYKQRTLDYSHDRKQLIKESSELIETTSQIIINQIDKLNKNQRWLNHLSSEDIDSFKNNQFDGWLRYFETSFIAADDRYLMDIIDIVSTIPSPGAALFLAHRLYDPNPEVRIHAAVKLRKMDSYWMEEAQINSFMQIKQRDNMLANFSANFIPANKLLKLFSSNRRHHIKEIIKGDITIRNPSIIKILMLTETDPISLISLTGLAAKHHLSLEDFKDIYICYKDFAKYIKNSTLNIFLDGQINFKNHNFKNPKFKMRKNYYNALTKIHNILLGEFIPLTVIDIDEINVLLRSNNTDDIYFVFYILSLQKNLNGLDLQLLLSRNLGFESTILMFKILKQVIRNQQYDNPIQIRKWIKNQPQNNSPILYSNWQNLLTMLDKQNRNEAKKVLTSPPTNTKKTQPTTSTYDKSSTLIASEQQLLETIRTEEASYSELSDALYNLKKHYPNTKSIPNLSQNALDVDSLALKLTSELHSPIKYKNNGPVQLRIRWFLNKMDPILFPEPAPKQGEDFFIPLNLVQEAVGGINLEGIYWDSNAKQPNAQKKTTNIFIENHLIGLKPYVKSFSLQQTPSNNSSKHPK